METGATQTDVFDENKLAEFLLGNVKTILKSIQDVKRIINDVMHSDEIKLNYDAGIDIRDFNWYIYKINESTQKIYDSLYQFKCQNDSDDEFVSKRSLSWYLQDANKQFN